MKKIKTYPGNPPRNMAEKEFIPGDTKTSGDGKAPLIAEDRIYRHWNFCRKQGWLFGLLSIILLMVTGCHTPLSKGSYSTLHRHFIHPPDSARPGVYWYFMDGNISREGMTGTWNP